MSFQALTVKSFWDANANDLRLSPGFGTNGDAYLVTVAGATNLGQAGGSWLVGDVAFFALDRWVKITPTFSLGIVGSAILKGNGSGGIANAVSGTDYAPPTSGAAILKGNGSGGFSAAVAATDYVAPGGALGTPSSGTATNLTGLPEGGLATTDITTNNVSTTKHGFAPKAPNDATKFLDGTGAYSVPAAGSAVFAGVRQTVAAGPVDTAGLPTFFPSTAVALSVTTQNVSGTSALVATAANGWSSTTGLPVDTIGFSTANLTWSSLTASTTNYLYGTISGGVITTAKTTLAPVYQWGGTPGTTSGQITFNIGEMRAYLGNGSTAPVTALVVFGEAVTSGSAVTSTVAYAYNGRFVGAYTATLPSTSTQTSKNHNLGVDPNFIDAEFLIKCTAIDNGYAVGDILTEKDFITADASTRMSLPLRRTRNAMSIATGSSAAWVMMAAAGGSGALATLASWSYAPVARRSF